MAQVPRINQSRWGEDLQAHLALTNTPSGGMNVAEVVPANPPEGWCGFITSENLVMRYSSGSWQAISNVRRYGTIDVYVSGSGSDDNTGLHSTLPMRTLEYAVDKAIGMISHGSIRVHMGPGDYLPINRLSSDHSIHLQGYKSNFIDMAVENEVNIVSAVAPCISGKGAVLELSGGITLKQNAGFFTHVIQVRNTNLKLGGPLFFSKINSTGGFYVDVVDANLTISDLHMKVVGAGWGIFNMELGSFDCHNANIQLTPGALYDQIFSLHRTIVRQPGQDFGTGNDAVGMTITGDPDPSTLSFYVTDMDGAVLDWVAWPPGAAPGVTTAYANV